MATWFAQNSSVNIDSVNQWNSAANGSGSWLTWASLDPTDVLVANGKTAITINVPVTCATITTAATGGTAGGGFIWPGNVAIVANITAGTTTVLTPSGSGTRTITGNLTGGTGSSAYCLAGTADVVTITGNIIGASSSTADGRVINNCTNLVIIGNVTGGSTSSNNNTINCDVNGTIFITGNVIAGTAANAIYMNVGAMTLTVNGTISTAANSIPAIRAVGTLNLRHTGDQIAASNGTLPVSGNVTNFLISSSATMYHEYRVNNSGSAGVARSLYTGGTNLGQPSAGNVRLGTTFGSASEYTGTLAVPSPTLVAIGVATDDTVGSYEPSGGASAADIADAVWDEARVGHATAGSYGATSEWVSSGDTAGVTELLTRIPDATAGTSGGLPVLSEGLAVTAELDSASTALLNDIPTTAEFEARTLVAASYATASQINSLQVNTRASVQVPVEIETPDSGTQAWKIRLFLFDSDGNMEAPDSTPTVALVNASGTDRSSRLSAATTLSTGAYSWDYTSTDDDTEEQLNWTFTVVEGGLTRIYPATSYVVEETAFRFTSTDRATLNSRASQTSVDDVPTNAELATALSGKASTSDVTTVGTAVAAVSTKLGTPAGASVSADIAAVKIDTGTTLPGLIDDIDGGVADPTVMVSTTIATLASQLAFTLTAGSADNDCYNNQLAVITDSATAMQKARVIVSDYVGSTKTITITSAPAFTIAVGDLISIIAVGSVVSGNAVSLTLGATIPLELGEVTGLTEPLVIGDDYTEDVGRRIPITLTDSNGDAIAVTYGSHSLATDCTIKALFQPEGNSTTKTVFTGTCTFVAAVGETPAFLWLSLPRAETTKASQGKYQIQIEARWTDGSNVTMAHSGVATFKRDIQRVI